MTKKHSNKDINKTKTHNNVGLWSYDEAVKRYDERIKEIDQNKKSTKRKDRVTCIGLNVPVPEGMKNRNETIAFFDEVLKQFEKRFGAKNCVGAWIHFDEGHPYIDHETGKLRYSRPHMQAYVIPETGGRLCAKEVMTRTNMIELNNEIEGIARQFGYKFMTGEKRKGMSVDNLKAQRNEERVLEEIVKLRDDLKNKVDIHQRLDWLTQTYIGIRDALDDVREVAPMVDKHIRHEYHFDEALKELNKLNDKHDDNDDYDDHNDH